MDIYGKCRYAGGIKNRPRDDEPHPKILCPLGVASMPDGFSIVAQGFMR